jgi:N-acetyl-gamma-glutamyl-phosphate reductase
MGLPGASQEGQGSEFDTFQGDSVIKVGVVGGTGYTGVELLRLLAQHPSIRLQAVTSRSESGQKLQDIYPNLRGHVDIAFTEPDIEVLGACDVVFFATPNGVAMDMAPALLERNTRIIDLAADFRLRNPSDWEKWYGKPHACTTVLADAVYGLPERYRERIKRARVIANPGCYPTAVQLGLLPLLEKGLIDTSRIIADCKSGVSGAGRQGKIANLLCETSESFKAYAVPGHRHWPEITQGLSDMSGQQVGLTFVPHLTPMIRGIHATLYAELSVDVPETELQSLFESRYRDEAFVDVLPQGEHPETRSVRGANHCRLAVHRPYGGRTVVVLSVIDNLVKGAAGQAIQNMNIMFGIPETIGLKHVALMP